MTDGLTSGKYNHISTNVKGVDISGRQSRDLVSHLKDQEEANKRAFFQSGISTGFEFQPSTSQGAMRFTSTYKEAAPNSSIHVPQILVPFTISQVQSSGQINNQNKEAHLQSNQIHLSHARSTQRNANVSSFLSSNVEQPKTIEPYKLQPQLGGEKVFAGGLLGH